MRCLRCTGASGIRYSSSSSGERNVVLRCAAVDICMRMSTKMKMIPATASGHEATINPFRNGANGSFGTVLTCRAICRHPARKKYIPSRHVTMEGELIPYSSLPPPNCQGEVFYRTLCLKWRGRVWQAVGIIRGGAHCRKLLPRNRSRYESRCEIMCRPRSGAAVPLSLISPLLEACGVEWQK